MHGGTCVFGLGARGSARSGDTAGGAKAGGCRRCMGFGVALLTAVSSLDTRPQKASCASFRS